MISPIEFRDNLSRLIRVVVLSIPLLILWSAARSVPGATAEMFDGLLVSAALQIVLGVILLGLAVSAAKPLGVIFSRYGATLLASQSGARRIKLAPAVTAVAERLAQAVVLIVAWRILDRILPRLMTMGSLINADWLPNSVTLAFLGLLLLFVWSIYVAARPLFDELSVTVSERIAVASERRCPSCGAPNPVGVSFCGSCGSALNLAPEPVRLPTPLRCQACGMENPPGSRFCVTCGISLARPEPRPILPPLPPATSPRQLFCPQCGAANSSDSRFCASCGSTLRSPSVAEPAARTSPDPSVPDVREPEPIDQAPVGSSSGELPVDEPVQSAEAPIQQCPKCASTIPPNSRFCASCGAPLTHPATVDGRSG